MAFIEKFHKYCFLSWFVFLVVSGLLQGSVNAQDTAGETSNQVDQSLLKLPEEFALFEDQTKVFNLNDYFNGLDHNTPPEEATWEVIGRRDPLLFASIDSFNQLSLWAAPDISGIFSLELKVTDLSGNQDSSSVSINIEAVHDIAFKKRKLEKHGTLDILLQGNIALPQGTQLEDIKWDWNAPPLEIIVLSLQDNILHLEAGDLFPDAAPIQIEITALNTKNDQKDIAILTIEVQRLKPRYIRDSDTIFVKQKNEIVLQDVDFLWDEIDHPSLIEWDIRVPLDQLFDVRKVDERFLTVKSHSDISNLGNFVLWFQNTAGFRDSVQIVVSVDPGPMLVLPPFVTMPQNGTTELVLRPDNLRTSFPQDTFLVSFQGSLKMNLNLQSENVEKVDFLNIRNVPVDTILFAPNDSLTGYVDTESILFSPEDYSLGSGVADTLLFTASDGFLGKEWVIVSVINKRTKLSYTAALPVFVGVLGPDFTISTDSIPKDSSLINLTLNTLPTPPRKSIAWPSLDPINNIEPQYQVAISENALFADQQLNIQEKSSETSFSIPDTFIIGNFYWIRVLVTYENLFCFWSEPIQIIPDRAPDEPMFIFPLDGAELLPTNMQISIHRIIDPDGEPVSYKIEASTDSNFNGPVFSQTFSNTSQDDTITFTLDPDFVPPGQTYYWRIHALSGDFAITSEVRKFTVYDPNPLEGVNLEVINPEISQSGFQEIMDKGAPFAWRLGRPENIQISSTNSQLKIADHPDSLNSELLIKSSLHESSGQDILSIDLETKLQSDSTYFYNLSIKYAVLTDTTKRFFFTTTGTQKFHVGHRPDISSILLPENRDTIKDNSFSVKWMGVQDADGDPITYIIQLARQPFGQGVQTVDIGSTSELSYNLEVDSLITKLPANGKPYYLRVCASDGLLTSYSEPIIFYVYAPSTQIQTNLIFPSNEQELDKQDSNFRLTWGAVPNARYIIRLGTHPNRGDLFENTVADTFLVLPKNVIDRLAYGISYYWSVQLLIPSALLRNKFESQSFRNEHRPSLFELSLPAADTTVHTLTPRLSWQASSLADGNLVSYQVLISQDATFDSTSIILNQDAGTSTSYDLPSGLVEDNQILFWKVIAIAPNGLTRESEHRRFQMNLFHMIPEFEQVLIVPSVFPTFRWKKYLIRIDEQVSEYIVEVASSTDTLRIQVVQAESLAVGSSQHSEPLIQNLSYSVRTGAVVGQDTSWTKSVSIFIGQRFIYDFYIYPNPVDIINNEYIRVHALFVEPVIQATLRILTAHPPHVPLLDNQNLNLTASRLSVDAFPVWNGTDALGRSLGYGIYIAELIVEYKDGDKDRAYYPIAIGPR